MEFLLKRKNNLLLTVLVCFLIFYRLLICVNYNPEISTGETNNIWNVLKVANGKSIYTDPENTPFEIFQYTPLSQLPVILAAKIYDPKGDHYYYYALLTGRFLSLLYNLLTFYLIYRLLKYKFGLSTTLSYASAVCGFGLLTHLAFAVRPDSFALLIVIFSIYLFAKAFFDEKRLYFILCGLTFSISFFAKQDSFLILSALGLSLLILRNWKDLIVLSLSFSFSMIVLVLLFKMILGKYFLFSILGGVSTGYTLSTTLLVFERFLDFYSIFFYLSIVFVYLLFTRLGIQKEKVFFISLTLISFSIAVCISFKIGSWINYYTPFLIFSIILIYYTVHLLSKNQDQKIIESALTYFTTIIVGVFVLKQIFHYTAPFLKYNESKAQHIELVNKLKPFKIESINHGYRIFSFDKPTKLILFQNTLFPNTEFYTVSKFSMKGYGKLKRNQKLTHIIIDTTEGDVQFIPIKKFNIPFNEYKEKTKILKYIIYEHER